MAQYNTKDKRIAEINKALRDGGANSVTQKRISNVKVPFLLYDEAEYKSNNFYHPETALGEQSWAVVINTAANTAYFKNMSDDSSDWKEAVSNKWQY